MGAVVTRDVVALLAPGTRVVRHGTLEVVSEVHRKLNSTEVEAVSYHHRQGRDEAHNLRAMASLGRLRVLASGEDAHRAELAQRAARMVEDYRDEYRRMVRDPLFSAYGGVASADGERAYVARRVDEVIAWNRGRFEDEFVEALQAVRPV